MPRLKKRRSAILPRLEVLEGRALLSGDLGQWPLRGADPATTLLVKFSATPDDGSSAPALTNAEQSTLASVSGLVSKTLADGTMVISLGQGVDPTGAIARLKLDPSVEFAEQDGVIRVAQVPNDAAYTQQWGLDQANDVDIDAPQAWDATTGTAATIVAVVDTGADLTNPEIASKLWTNPVDGTHGYNAITGTNNPQDDHGHGTLVSGIIAAASNNGIGVAGVNWNAQIMPMKFISASGSGSTSAAITAILWAADHGAKVINASWGGGGADQALISAIQYAGSKGAVFVAAAGNNGMNDDNSPFYPASYHLSNMLSVASVDQDGSLSGFSNYGANSVDVAAPGSGIVGVALGGGLTSMSGTSASAPFVSGVISLLAGAYPNLSPEALVGLVKGSVKPLASLAGKTVTGGMVSASRALAAAAAASVPPPVVTPATQIMDDSDPGFTTTGNWIRWTYSGYHGNSTYAAGTATGDDVATWSFNVTPGLYRVSSNWLPQGNRATNAPYTVYDGATAVGTASINQQLAPDNNQGTTDGTPWQDLGTFAVGSTSLKVTLSSLANQYVIADGMKIERIGDAAPIVQIYNGTTPLLNGGTTDFGSVTLGQSSSQTFTVRNLGTAPLVLSGQPTVPDGFTLTSGLGATTLAAGASTSFTVAFNPTALGSLTGTISLETNDANTATYRLNVGGVGTAPPASTPPLVIDNASSGFSDTGQWFYWPVDGYDSSVRYASSNPAGTDIATWTAILGPGTYRVSATWSPLGNRATDAPYSVSVNGSTVWTTRLNQQVSPASFNDGTTDWADIGIVSLGDTGTIEASLGSNANLYVIADAIRIEKIG